MNQDEALRLAALHEYRVLDAPADDELSALVRVAATVAGVPYATLNLIDERRQCQLTTVGFQGGDSSRESSMCALVFERGEFVHVPDARADPRFATNPWVTGLLADVRFYATAPLITPSGHALGSLCVFDGERHELDDVQIARLKDLAQVVLALFERRRQARVNAHLAAAAEEGRALMELTMREMDARQEFTDAVLDTIDVAVVAADPDGHLTLFNRASRDWHGLDADARIDPSQHADRYALFRADRVTPMQADEVPLHRALVEGKVTGVEMVIAPADRPATVAVCSGRALTRADGTPLGAVVALTDVTADRERQAALRAAHVELTDRGVELAAAVTELERSNAELEQFAAIASHDLNSPLTVVAGYIELLADVYGHDLDDQANEWIATALKGVTRMQGLINALLAYAQAGGSTCQRELTDVREVLYQAVLDLRAAALEAGARVSATDLPTAYCDPTLLRQLLQNLIANAVKYRHPRRPCQIEVSAVAQGDGWIVSVADNGIGIPEEHRTRVFDMFAMVEGSGRNGHGIGLATCHRIVDRHGGRIWAEPTEGGGTTIRFSLPQRSPRA